MNLLYRIFSPTPKPMRTCSKCKVEKKLTNEFFHNDSKGRQGFSAQCKLCRNKTKRKTLHEPYKNLTLSEIKKIRIHPEPEMIQTGLVSIPLPTGSLYSLSSDLKAFARIHDRLLKHFGRMYWMKVEADGRAEIRAYGKEHSEQFRGRSILEVINNIFSS